MQLRTPFSTTEQSPWRAIKVAGTSACSTPAQLALLMRIEHVVEPHLAESELTTEDWAVLAHIEHLHLLCVLILHSHVTSNIQGAAAAHDLGMNFQCMHVWCSVQPFNTVR
jgi:hypothetical protein